MQAACQGLEPFSILAGCLHACNHWGFCTSLGEIAGYGIVLPFDCGASGVGRATERCIGRVPRICSLDLYLDNLSRDSMFSKMATNEERQNIINKISKIILEKNHPD